MEQFIQVLIEASSSFSWWHWLLGLGVAALSGGFGIGIVFAIKEFEIWFPYNIENYIVDFYIAEKKIAIEVDGRQHLLPEHRQADEQRDRDLASWGISVLRYSNNSIRNCFDAVVADILWNLELDFDDLKTPN